MSDDEANAKDEMINNIGEISSADKLRADMDNQVNDIEELGEVGKQIEDRKVDNVEDTESKEISKEKQEEQEGHGMKNVEESVDLKGKGKNDEQGSRENSSGEEDDETPEKMEEYIEDEGKEHGDEEKGGNKKRSCGRRVGANADKDKKDRRRSRDALEIPFSVYPDRPVRERKAVVRLVEIIEKGLDEGVHVEKGCGIPLKNIPNVARKLSMVKPEDLKLLHMILFGRKGKAPDFKSHILQFSGFVWHGNEVKQKTKVQEKLDKCTKDQLLDLCNVLDIPLSSASIRKEDLIVKLLDFTIAPHASTTDKLLYESKQNSTSTLKRKKSSQVLSPSSSAKHSRKRAKTVGDASNLLEVVANTEQDSFEGGIEEMRENATSNGHGNAQHSESKHESESDDSADEGSIKTEKSGKEKKEAISKPVNKSSSRKKISGTPDKSSGTSSKHTVSKEMGDTDRVFSRRKKADATYKTKSKFSKLQPRVTNKGKNLGKGKVKSGKIDNSGPSNDEVRKKICQILKDADFNTATFNDILRELVVFAGSHYKIDLMPRKEIIKTMVKEELTKLAEAEVQQDMDDESDENTQLEGKGLQS